jgi:hypothetical protein
MGKGIPDTSVGESTFHLRLDLRPTLNGGVVLVKRPGSSYSMCCFFETLNTFRKLGVTSHMLAPDGHRVAHPSV